MPGVGATTLPDSPTAPRAPPPTFPHPASPPHHPGAPPVRGSARPTPTSAGPRGRSGLGGVPSGRPMARVGGAAPTPSRPGPVEAGGTGPSCRRRRRGRGLQGPQSWRRPRSRSVSPGRGAPPGRGPGRGCGRLGGRLRRRLQRGASVPASERASERAAAAAAFCRAGPARSAAAWPDVPAPAPLRWGSCCRHPPHPPAPPAPTLVLGAPPTTLPLAAPQVPCLQMPRLRP